MDDALIRLLKLADLIQKYVKFSLGDSLKIGQKAKISILRFSSSKSATPITFSCQNLR